MPGAQQPQAYGNDEIVTKGPSILEDGNTAVIVNVVIIHCGRLVSSVVDCGRQIGEGVLTCCCVDGAGAGQQRHWSVVAGGSSLGWPSLGWWWTSSSLWLLEMVSVATVVW